MRHTPYVRDDWDKPRTHGMKLTAAEIQRIRVAFNIGIHAREIARELQCSSRVANKYYGQFRGYKRPTPHEKPKITERPKSPRPVGKSRFYTSNFEL